MPAEDAPLLDELAAGRVPQAWQPLTSTTLEEVNFLSPLDNLLGRSRTRALFGFEYLWEVYKPAEHRQWGRYTMPVLYGDRLVARIDPKLDRKTGTLVLDGFWLEDDATANDLYFANALARGLAQFARFHAATRLELSAINPGELRENVQASIVL